ncbi:cilia- and flagella-associated protein 144 [Myripristis murdjan]|uniref:cilia- and flagella-associated protein 144 n=1 Tax=Myripristis murdjan TaxID=586833 RepID=UPI001175EDB0|nr:protein FAM183A [Myripristis murdjan]
MSGAKADKAPVDLVHQNAIHVETVRKELRTLRLHTHFSLSPHKKLHPIQDKPMSKKPQEVDIEDSDFITAFHTARLEPTKKYTHPQTESQAIGWISTPLIVSDRSDRRFHFHRQGSDVSKYMETASRFLK